MLGDEGALRDDDSGARLVRSVGAAVGSSTWDPETARGNRRARRADEERSVDLESRLRQALDRTLRDPVATVRVAVAAFPQDAEGSHADQMRHCARALVDIDAVLADLSDFAVTRCVGGLRIARRRVDLKLLCERVLDAIQGTHPESPLLFACCAPVEGTWDPDRVASLVSRLVTNAIVHGALRRAVKVTLDDLGDRAAIEVKSHGRLDDEVANRLFEPFVSSENARAARGLGLGLHLAREIVRAHGGQIEVRAVGGEVTVRAELPRENSAAAPR